MHLKTIETATSFSTQALAGKCALVTGGGRGIGRATALKLAQAGCRLFLLGRNQERLLAVSAELEALANVPASHMAIDVADSESLENAVQFFQNSQGIDIDILVNNAGIYRTEAVENHDLQSWREMLEVNLTSALVAARAVLPAMIKKEWGRIVNVSSISGKCAEAYGAAYSATKFALIGLTQATALENAKYGITVNAVCPGWVATDMAFEQIGDPRWCDLNGLDPEQALAITKLSVPIMRLIEPAEVAGLIVYLCTQEAAAITGQAINICGGMSIQ